MWSLGNFLEKLAKGWAVLTSIAFVYFVWAVLSGGTIFGSAYQQGYEIGAKFAECVVWGFFPAGLIYAIARALQRSHRRG